MIPYDNAVEEINLLTQSPVRVRILKLLHEQGELDRRELTEQFDVSRVTVKRNLDALEQQGWIANSRPGYGITPLGEIVVEEFYPAIDTFKLNQTLRPFLQWFPEDDLEFDVRALADAKVVVSDSSNPYAPVNRHLEVMQSADRFRCLLPAVALQPMMAARDCVIEYDQEQEVVFGANVASTLEEEPEYEEVIDELAELDNCRLLVARSELSYYLGLCEECVQIGVEDDDGVPKALVETEAEEVREWAEGTYQDYLIRAEPFVLDW